jgi:hypothetical protein
MCSEYASCSSWPILLVLGATLLLICKFMALLPLICNFMFHGDLGSVRQDYKKKKKKEAREKQSPPKNKKSSCTIEFPRLQKKQSRDGNGDRWGKKVLTAAPKRNKKKNKKKRDPDL